MSYTDEQAVGWRNDARSLREQVRLLRREVAAMEVERDAAVARLATARRDVVQAVAQLARDHGATYRAEIRPCPCKTDCSAITSPRQPFADLIVRTLS